MLFAFFLSRQRPHPIPFGPSTELHSFFNMSTCFLVPENVMRLAFHLCKLPGVFDFYRDPRNQEAAQLGGQIGRAILLQIESMVFDPRGKIPTCITCIYALWAKMLGTWCFYLPTSEGPIWPFEGGRCLSCWSLHVYSCLKLQMNEQGKPSTIWCLVSTSRVKLLCGIIFVRESIVFRQIYSSSTCVDIS